MESFSGSLIERVWMERTRTYSGGELVQERVLQEIKFRVARAQPPRVKRWLGPLMRAALWLFSSYSETKEFLGDIWRVIMSSF